MNNLYWRQIWQKNGEIFIKMLDNSFAQWLEPVFLPLYGKEIGAARRVWVEEVLRFEADLYRGEKLSARLLAAALILSNKLLDKAALRQIWEDVKMLDILEIAREEGMKEGELLGIQKGKTLGLQEGMVEMMMEVLVERFGLIPAHLSEQIRGIRNQDVLRGLLHEALKSQSVQDFEAMVTQIF